MKQKVLVYSKLIVGLALLMSFRSTAQESVNLGFQRSVPQSFKNNPATEVPYGFWIGMPALSGLYLGFENSGFRYKDVITRTPDDSLHFSIDGFLNSLDKKNVTSLDLQNELLAFGFHAGKMYFDIRVTERFSSSFVYTKDLMSFITGLNGQFIGETASFSGTGVNISDYHEISLGIQKPYTEKWSVGARFKFLAGLANLYSRKTNISIFTDPAAAYALTATSDIEINSSIPGLLLDPTDSLGFNIDNQQLEHDLGRIGNPGVGIDLGVLYQYKPNLKLGFSLTDLGMISWRTNTRNYVSDKQHHSYTFEGIDINEFISKDTTSFSDQLGKVLDSLKSNLGIVTTYKHYSSPLLTRLNLTAEWSFTPKDHLAALMRLELANKTALPLLCIHYNHEFGKIFNLMTGYSIKKGNYLNVGLGFSLKLLGFQLYMLSDNAYAALQPRNFKTVNMQFGINFCFRDRRFKKQDTPPAPTPPPALPGNTPKVDPSQDLMNPR